MPTRRWILLCLILSTLLACACSDVSEETILASTSTPEMTPVVVQSLPTPTLTVLPMTPSPTRKPAATLSSRDALIAHTFLCHAYSRPDPNESEEALRGYLEGDQIMRDPARLEKAVAYFEKLMAQYPDSRHAVEGYAVALSRRFKINGSRADDVLSTDLFVRALGMGMKYDYLSMNDLRPAALGLGRLCQIDRIEALFDDISRRFPTEWAVPLACAEGLAEAGSPKAEVWFDKAVEIADWKTTEPWGERQKWRENRDRGMETLPGCNAAK